MAADASAVPLLEKIYYDDCAGCRMDRRKDTHTGKPYKEFFYVCIATLCASLPISSLFPFLYFMIRDLHVAKTEEDIGFYAGFVGASFMFGRALTSVFWGIAADHYGRKPVILFGTLAVVIFNTLFGISTSFWMAIITRFLLGCLNGLLGPLKAYSSEICRPEHQALGLSLITTSWGVGLIIGPAIGGFLAQPAEKYPQIFSKNSVFGRFPYFLPCVSISFFAACTFVACLWLPETLHKHKSECGHMSYETLESSISCPDSKENNGKLKESEPASKKNLLRNWPLMSSIIIYCVFSLHDMAYTEIFSLWAESDKNYGGLSLSTQDVGEVLAVTGCSLLIFQLFLYPFFERALGPIISARIAAVFCIPLLSSYALYCNLSGFWLKLVVNIASLLKNILSITVIIGLFILQNNAVEQHQRGAANGISMTAMSLFKAAAPAGGGALFSFAEKRQHSSFLPGNQLVFFALNVVELLGLLLTFRPFLMEPSRPMT